MKLKKYRSRINANELLCIPGKWTGTNASMPDKWDNEQVIRATVTATGMIKVII